MACSKLAPTPQEQWRERMTTWYRDILTTTFCVPAPFHFNKVPYCRETVPGTGESAFVLKDPSVKSARAPSGSAQSAAPGTSHGHSAPQALWQQESPQLVPATVLASDIHDDFAQNHVLKNLRALGTARKEAMFILSQLNFGDYLNKPTYAAAVKQLKLPLPADVDTPLVKYSDGEIDFIIFHRLLGILIGELKAVGRYHILVENTEAPDADVVKRVQTAVKQLTKSKLVVSHIISDIAPGMTVRTTLFLPFVSSTQLLRVLTANPPLGRVSMLNSLAVSLSLCIVMNLTMGLFSFTKI
jgi:hypothetical protein